MGGANHDRIGPRQLGNEGVGRGDVGPTRFGALRRQVEGISSRVLTERLRGLEQKGILYREYEPTIPPAVTYGIAKRMRRLSRSWEN